MCCWNNKMFCVHAFVIHPKTSSPRHPSNQGMMYCLPVSNDFQTLHFCTSVFFLVNLIGMHAGSCDSYKALSWAIKNMLDWEKMMITLICYMGNIKFEFEFLFYIVCRFNAPSIKFVSLPPLKDKNIWDF